MKNQPEKIPAITGGAGFFLIHLDGTVTPSIAVASLALGGSAPARLRLREALNLSAEAAGQFLKWLDLVHRRHRNLSWGKLEALAPVSEISYQSAAGESHCRLTYRKLEDASGDLAALSVMVIDAGPGRALARQLEAERQRHNLEIRDVVALSANPPEVLGGFLDDAVARLDGARRGWDAFLARSKPGFENGKRDTKKASAETVWSGTGESPGQLLFRELHMVKGNAGAFGFEGMAANAQASEDLLEALKHASPDSDRITARLTSALSDLRLQLEEIRRALKLIAGEGQDAMTRVLKWKLDRLVIAAQDVDTASLNPSQRKLVESTRQLANLSPAYLARKYKNLVERIAHNLGKQIDFRVTSNSGDIHPESFARVDEALVHILRNMVDHGIESPAERTAAGKGEAVIDMEYVAGEANVLIRIRDDGRGMDPEVIADRAVALGLLSSGEAEGLDDTGKLGLIFREGFTTRDTASMVSGRGLGLALAAKCVADRGGNLYVYSRPGEGARFAIELPPLGH